MIPRQRRKVRLHLVHNEPSIEGFFVGFWAKHYILELPEVLAKIDERQPIGRAKVPREKVLILEEIS